METCQPVHCKSWKGWTKEGVGGGQNSVSPWKQLSASKAGHRRIENVFDYTTSVSRTGRESLPVTMLVTTLGRLALVPSKAVTLPQSTSTTYWMTGWPLDHTKIFLAEYFNRGLLKSLDFWPADIWTVYGHAKCQMYVPLVSAEANKYSLLHHFVQIHPYKCSLTLSKGLLGFKASSPVGEWDLGLEFEEKKKILKRPFLTFQQEGRLQFANSQKYRVVHRHIDLHELLPQEDLCRKGPLLGY